LAGGRQGGKEKKKRHWPLIGIFLPRDFGERGGGKKKARIEHGAGERGEGVGGL